MGNSKNKVLLIVLDGLGIRGSDLKNAVIDSNPQFLNQLLKTYPSTTLKASEEFVGLPAQTIGNSEVGHLNLGAGRVVFQDLPKINNAIQTKDPIFLAQLDEMAETSKKNGSKIHLMGLVSDGGVHSHIEHPIFIARYLYQKHKIKTIFHAFTDGRDTPLNSGIQYLKKIVDCPEIHLASLHGRFYAMDRDKRWDRVQKSYDVLTQKNQIAQKLSVIDYIQKQYQEKIFDEFIQPTCFDPESVITENDSILFFNFRPDRARQLSLAFTDPAFNHFPTAVKIKHLYCMTSFGIHTKSHILFPKSPLKKTLSEVISSHGDSQFKIAETEKYAHVTYFFNGGKEEAFPLEERTLIPSVKHVTTYDLHPPMSAPEITEQLQNRIKKGTDAFYLVNFANPDMIGHTGNYEAAKVTLGIIDNCLKSLIKQCLEQNIYVVITSDHGNIDQMIHEDGTPHTAHTLSSVPFILVHKSLKDKTIQITDGPVLSLQNVAPTIYQLMYGSKDMPNEFTGESLVNYIK